MATQTVIWTALPRDLAPDGQHVRLSAFVSPRLQLGAGESQELRHFPDFLHWPDVVKALTFNVQLVNGASIPATVVNSELDTALWQSLFNETTFVRSHTFDDYSSNPIRSYSVRNVTNVLRQNYQALGVASPGSIPRLSDISGRQLAGGVGNALLRTLGPNVVKSLATLAIPWNGDPTQLDGALSYQGNINKYYPGSPEQYHPDFMRFLQFHYMPYDPNLHLPGTLQDTARMIDFHQALSSLASYPELLRRLGLVVDLEIPASALAQDTTGAQRFIEVIPQPVRRDFVSPMTAFTWNGTIFAAVSQSGEIRSGMLNLGNELYDVVQVDIDGAAFKTVNYAVNFIDVFHPSIQDRDLEKDMGLPSTRSAGISVTRSDRAGLLQTTIANSKQFNDALNQYLQNPQSQPPQFFVEALLRGFRVDFWDSRTGQWHSLCERIGDYQFLTAGDGKGGTELKDIHDEGFVQMGASQPVINGVQPPALHLHESIFRWNGWSLVAPRPGKSLSASSDPSAPPSTPSNDPVTPFKLKTSFTAEPHSLPTLRFGVNYQVRARVVDLAGNSLTLAEANALSPMPDVPPSPTAFEYLRYDPVIAPAIVLRQLIDTAADPGETLERPAIRSFNTNPSLDTVPATQTSERHIAPPKASELMAETHGMFDTPSGAPDPSKYALIAQKDKGSFATQPFVDGSQTIQVPVEPDAQLALPYLPDPLARGAAFRNLPGAPSSTKGTIDAQGKLVYQPQPLTEYPPEPVTIIDFGPESAWPNLLPFRVVIAEGSGAPSWDKSTRVLTLPLPKAEQITVNLSSFLEKDDLKLMGVWQWLRDGINTLVQQYITQPDVLEAIESAVALMVQYALEGGHWMLTPARTLMLTHAVQQPIGQPDIRILTALKSQLGQTYAELRGSVGTHGKSTVKLDMLAMWQDPQDDPTGSDGKKIVNGSAHAFEAPITLPGDTSSGSPIAFYDPIAETLSFLSYNPPRHEFGDTRYRRVHYQAEGTSRFREFFQPNAPGGFTRSSAEMIVDVPNSARPAAPKVLYVVPTFGWSGQTDTNLKVSQRKGGGLRVYLDHPWYSSGDGELLGVVLWSQSSGLAPDQLKPYVTQWGLDPIWGTASTISGPPLGRFTNAAAIDDGLTLEELQNVTVGINNANTQNPTVAVAGHTIQYDPDRGLWYCDIEIQSPDTYYPFVRLALARYQPHSIMFAKSNPANDSNVLISTLDEHGNVQVLQVSDNGETSVFNGQRTNNISGDACLSRVVLADFAQIAPDRSLIITYDPYNANQLTVVVSGTTYTSSFVDTFNDVLGPPDPGRRIEVSVEQRIAGITDDALAWEPDTNIQAQPYQTSISNEILWSGRVTLPANRAPGQYRLVVKEYELFYAGSRIFTGATAESATPGEAVIRPIPRPIIVQRLVYADAIPL